MANVRWTVNCVGVSHEFPTDFVDTSEEELNTIVNVNVCATLRITSLIAPAMVSLCVPSLFRLHCTLTLSRATYSKKGLILNMGSFAGASPTPMLAVYSGSKAFLRTWSDALTAELTPKGITVEHANTYFVVRLLSLLFSSRTTLNASVRSCRLRPCLKFVAHRCSFRPQKSSCAPCSRRSPRVPARRTGAMRWLARPWRSCAPKCFWHTCIHCRRTQGGVPSQNRRGLRSNSKTKMTQIMFYLSPVRCAPLLLMLLPLIRSVAPT
jgi:hypothetical protein